MEIVGALSQIDHTVVLMLENRSFDSMLGALYPPSPTFDGLTGSEFNLDAQGVAIPAANIPGSDPITMSTPTPDPGELWADINMQIFGTSGIPNATSSSTMSGFAKNYMAQVGVAPGNYDPKGVMHHYSVEQVPVISNLARQFAVCDRWFASAPCQTWPNRFFVHTGTAHGYENNDPPHFPTMETIFNRFELAGTEDWKIYFHDIAQSKTLTELWLLSDHFHFCEQFQSDAKAGTLPAYSFIEPRYFSEWSMPNDQHPPHVVTLGEQLIADVYNSLRGGPAWTKTMLIIIYDEHGGCYDHVPPPPAAPPSSPASQPFNFDRYGVRVPAVIISPYVKQGTMLRPPGTTPYDHTSVIATLRKRYPELGSPLTSRDATAPDLDNALTLPTPSNLGPERIDALPYTASPTVVAQAQSQPLNHMQKGLVKLAANLPTAAATAGTNSIADHISNIQAVQKEPPIEVMQNVGNAATYVKQQLGRFFSTV